MRERHIYRERYIYIYIHTHLYIYIYVYTNTYSIDQRSIAPVAMTLKGLVQAQTPRA